MCAGEIPAVGDFIMSRGWSFDIVNADDKRILLVKVERLVGSLTDTPEEHKQAENPLKNLLNRTLKKESLPDPAQTDSNANGSADDVLPATTAETVQVMVNDMVADNMAEAREVERMVEAGERKMELLENMKSSESPEADTF
jgi:hypothetical protein